MADQARDNQVEEEWTSEGEDQVEDECASNKGQTKEDGHLDRDIHVENEEGVEMEFNFPQFLRLPAEIRLIIWKYALPDGRVLRICPNEQTDDEGDEDGEDDDGYNDGYGSGYNYDKKWKKKGIDQWGFPTCCYAPEILNPPKFLTFPLAAVCQESREFIIDFGYETLYGDLMTVNGDRFQGPWFCHGRDTIEEFTEDMIIKLSSGGLRGDWIYE
ncbi:hypothetical protein F5B21DRAFT_500418 [Xylaria acuta]|nr:hypothetical protein F5B21DRAFT_500418 [Xylaria acuta]